MNRKLIPLLLVCLIIVITFVTSLLIYKNTITYRTKAEVSSQETLRIAKEPQNEQITNLSGNEFTIKWLTETPTIGKVSIKTPSGTKIFREKSKQNSPKTNEHIIVVNNLIPFTSYDFSIHSDNFEYKNDIYTVSTLPKLPEDTELPNSPRLVNLVFNSYVNKSFKTYDSLYTKNGIMYNKSAIEKANLESPILVIVNTYMYYQMKQRNNPLEQWAKERVAENHDVMLMEYQGGTPEDIRTLIKDFYEDHPDLSFVWLVGDIPPSGLLYNPLGVTDTDYFTTELKEEQFYPTDIFYMSLQNDPCENYTSFKSKNSFKYCINIKTPDSITIDVPVARLPDPVVIFNNREYSYQLLDNYFKKRKNYETKLNNKILYFYSDLKGENKVDPLAETLQKKLGSDITIISPNNSEEQKKKPAIEMLRMSLAFPNSWDMVYIVAHGDRDSYGVFQDTQTYNTLSSPEVIKNKLKARVLLNSNCLNGYYLSDSMSMRELFLGDDTVGILGSTSLNVSDNEQTISNVFNSALENESFTKILKEFYVSKNCDNNLVGQGIQVFSPKTFRNLTCNTERVFLGDPSIKLFN